VLQRSLKDSFRAATVGVQKVDQISGSFHHSRDVINHRGARNGARDGAMVAQIAAHHLGAARSQRVGARQIPRENADLGAVSKQAAN
jgi:hypothetical protein